MQESYISHVRITEDGNYQSSPPPPDAPRDQKKDRVIIISVKKSGRVRVHKARENGNGTFSIGKTWALDDLTAIESFKGATPRTPQEAQAKSWAGDRGFIVTLGKNYYWQANSSEERLLFITSLTKVYIKYTNGRQPRLIGFSDEEMDTLLQRRLIAPQSQPQQNLQFGPRPGQPQKFPSTASSVGSNANGRPPLPPPAARQPSEREPPRPSTGNNAQPPLRQPRPQASVPSFNSARPSTATSAAASPLSRYESGSEPPSNAMRQPPVPSDRRAPFDGRNQAPFSNIRDETEQPPPRSRGGMSNGPTMPGRFPSEVSTPGSEDVNTPDGSFMSRAETLVEEPIPPVPAAPPERRRPPLNMGADRPGTSDSSRQPMIPAPLATPTSQRDHMRPPARSNDRPEPPQPLRVKPGPPPTSMERPGSGRGDSSVIAPVEAKAKPEPEPTPAASPEKPPPLKIEVQTPASPEPVQPPAEEERPGLGLMIKKKTKADVANMFRNMASAASASQTGFKPRAGGAAERLRELALQAKAGKAAEGPDGITGVVPAPSLLRRATEETSRPSTAEPAAAVKKPSLDISMPEVKITSASDQNLPAMKLPAEPLKSKLPEKKAKETKKKRLPESTKKDLASLGIDPIIVSDERSAEFASLLDEFGWFGDGVHTKPIEELQADINRELSKAQIGGWFDRLDEEDERVENMKKDIDAVIAECDELDGLLTLYSVELGVSFTSLAPNMYMLTGYLDSGG